MLWTHSATPREFATNFKRCDDKQGCRLEYRPRNTTVDLFATTISTSNKTILLVRDPDCDCALSDNGKLTNQIRHYCKLCFIGIFPRFSRVENPNEWQNLFRYISVFFSKPCCVMRIVHRLRPFRQGAEGSFVL